MMKLLLPTSGIFSRLIICFSLFFFHINFDLKAKEKYSMQELEALYQQESYEEMLNHMQDISPTQRDKKWRKLLLSGSVSYAKLFKGKEECGKSFSFLKDQLKTYPILKKENSYLDLFTEQGICAIKHDQFYRYEWQKTGDQITTIDTRDQTIYKLSTSTLYNKGFFSVILKNQSKYKDDKKVHLFIHFNLTPYVNLRKNELGSIQLEIPKLKMLYDKFNITQHQEVKEDIEKTIKKEYERALNSGRKISKGFNIDNALFLAKKYKLLTKEFRLKVFTLKDKGFYPLVKQYKKEFIRNKKIIGHLVDDWKKIQSNDSQRPLLEELLVDLEACQLDKSKEELFHLKRLKKDIHRSLVSFDEPGGYHGRLNNHLTVKEFKLAQKCQGIPQEIFQNFLLLTFFYEIPYRDGKKSKPNALFFYSAEWLERLGKKEKLKLVNFVKEKDLHDLFHQFRFFKKDKAVQYMKYFPSLYQQALTDCQYALKDDSLGIKRKKKYRVSNRELCELITQKD